MKTIHLRFESTERLPLKGEKVRMQGLAGVYEVKIKNILKREVHPTDGAILMKVQGTKKLLSESSKNK